MPVIKSFSDPEPDDPEFAYEVIGSTTVSFFPSAGVMREGVEFARVIRGIGNPTAEVHGPEGTTKFHTRLIPMYQSPTANFIFRRSPMLELFAAGTSKPVAAYWFHEHRLPEDANPAPHRFRLLPCDGFQNRALDLSGRLILKLHDAWRDSERERGMLFGVELVDSLSEENTLFAILGLLMIRREVIMRVWTG